MTVRAPRPPAPIAAGTDVERLGHRLHERARRLFPLHRSITGDGVRETLAILSETVPLEIHEVPSGTRALDWIVPPEWRIGAAFIEDESSQRIVDVADSTLHVVAYSRPVDAVMPWSELRDHVHTLPGRPAWVPYRTAFEGDRWGFCMRHDRYQMLERYPERRYRVHIDSAFFDGSLTYGEIVLPGAVADEILLWTHICHPSMANDNLSGVVVVAEVAAALAERDLRHTVRVVFAPATFGAVTWLERNRHQLGAVRHGLVLAGLGDPGPLTYKRSRHGSAVIDRAAAHVLRHADPVGAVRDFDPFGYDERQFCSPGFDLPVGCLMRTPNGAYPEYHTSADDLDLVRPWALADAWSRIVEIIDVVERDRVWRNVRPDGEPRLALLGLYDAFRHGEDRETLHRAVMWTLNLSDGRYTLLEIAERSDIPFDDLLAAVDALRSHGLLDEVRAGMTESVNREE